VSSACDIRFPVFEDPSNLVATNFEIFSGVVQETPRNNKPPISYFLNLPKFCKLDRNVLVIF